MITSHAALIFLTFFYSNFSKKEKVRNTNFSTLIEKKKKRKKKRERELFVKMPILLYNNLITNDL